MTKLKRILPVAALAMFALFTMTGCTAAGSGTDGSGGGLGGYSMILMLVVLVAVFYFFMIRPENKRKKKQQEMRESLAVGDKIVTIGGMIGRVVSIGSDHLTFETGEDRVRIQVAKWAISTTGKDVAEAEQQK